MAFTTFTPKAANTVQAQTINQVTHLNGVPVYKLTDGTIIPVESCQVREPKYVPIAGDYLVVTNHRPTVWKASDFTANYS